MDKRGLEANGLEMGKGCKDKDPLPDATGKARSRKSDTLFLPLHFAATV